MTASAGAICFGCKRWKGRVCDAFPDGIPESIMFDGFDHRQPHEGDHDLRFVLGDQKRLDAYEAMMALIAGMGELEPEPELEPEFKHGTPGEPGYHLKHPGRFLTALREHPVNVKLTEAFENTGHSLFLVGGSVRDALAGNVNFADLDYTTDARPDQIRQAVDDLGPLWEVGEEFGTIGVQIDDLKTEITTYRKEVYDDESRKPVVAFGDNIADDLARRDLTMNAMALTMVGDGTHEAGDLVDPYGGAEDLRAGVLRTPDDPAKSMSEDPLRQLRVVRFAAKRNAAVDPALAEAVLDQNERLAIVSAERRTAEMRKIFDGGPQITANAIDLSRQLGVSQALFAGLDTSPARAEAVRRLPPDADHAAMLSVLADDVPDAADQMRAAVLMNDEMRPVLGTLRLVETLRSAKANRIEARRLVRDYEPDVVRRALAVMDALDGKRSAMATEVADVFAAEVDVVRAPLGITGRDLIDAGMKPGPAIGEALRRATEAFLVDPTIDRDALLAAALSP